MTRALVAEVLCTALEDERIHLPRRALERLIGRIAELLDERTTPTATTERTDP